MNIKSITKKILLGAKNFILPCVVIAYLLFIASYHLSNLDTFTNSVKEHVISFRFFRWGIIGSVFLLWPYLVACIGKSSSATAEQITQMKRKRFRILGWLILFEIIVCENFIGKLIQIL
jgi:ABC-type molybdate transport system permease subunit